MEEPTFEEIVLQGIFDLKNEVVREFESHQRLYNEALISICFLKGIDPPPSLVANSGAAVKTSKHKNSINSISLNGRFSEAYEGYFCTKRGSSTADRPAFYQGATKRRRLEKNLGRFEENGDGGRQIAGDEPVVGKGHCQDTQEGNEGKSDLPHTFVDGLEELEKQEERESDNGGGEDNCRVGGTTPARENLLNAHRDRRDEKREGGGGEEEKEDINVVHKGGRGGRRRVGAKEKKKKSDVAAALPVGRITRSKARQCQIVLSAEKETGKRKAIESKEQPEATRNTRARHKLQTTVEVPEEPMNVAAMVSPSACPEMAVSLQTGERNSSSPLLYPVLPQTGGIGKPSLLPSPVTVALSQTGGTGNSSPLPSPVIVALSQTGRTGKSSPLPSPVKAVPSQTGGRESPSLFPSPVVAVAPQTRDRGNSSSETNEINATETNEINAIRDNAAYREEMVTVEMKPNFLELVCEYSNDMDYCTRVPEEDTTKVFQECTGGWPSSSPAMTLQQNKDNSAAPVMIQLEVVAMRDNVGHGEEIVTGEVKLNSLDLVCEGSNDMDCKRIPQKDTPKIVQECAEGWPSPRPCRGNSADMKDAEQSEALNAKDAEQSEALNAKDAEQSEALDAIETIQLQDTSNIAENGQLSHMTTPEMQIPSQLQDSLHPLERKAFGNIVQVDSSSVSKSSMLPEMLTSQCSIPHPANTLRSRSVGLDRSRSVLVKETMSDSKLLVSIKQAHNAIAGREEFLLKKEMPFSKFARLCKPSEMLYSQGNQNQNYVSHKEGSPGLKVAMEELTGNEDTETPISHDVFQQTSICRSSSFNNDAGKQSTEMELETISSAAALRVSCQSFPGVMEDLSIHSVKTGVLEGSYGNKIEPSWSDCDPVRSTLNHGMGECEEGGLIPQNGRPTSSMDMSVKVPSEEEEDLTSQMVEVTEFGAQKHDESSLSPLQSGVSPGKLGALDSDLRSFCQVEAGMRQREILCDAPRNTPVDLKDRIPSIRGKSFSRNMVPWKEDRALKLQNKSWPGYQKQRSLAQEEFSSARQPRLLRSESCSKAYEYNTSVQGATLDGVGLNDLVENDEQRHDDMVIFSPKDFSCPQEGSLDAFLSSEMKRDENLSPKDIECRQMARLLLNEQFKREKLSMKMGYPRLSCLTDLAEQKCLSRNEVFSRNLPSYTAYAKIKEGSLSCIGLPQFEVDGMSSNCTSVSFLLDKTHLHATPSKSQSFGYSFEVTSPQDRGQQGDSKTVPSDEAISEFSFQKVLGGMDKCDMIRTPLLKRNVVTELGQCGLSKSVAVNKKPSNQFGLEFHEVFTGGKDSLVKRDMEATELYNGFHSFTPMPNKMLKCRKHTPSDARWTHIFSDSSDHSENSIKCWGREYPSAIDYSGSLTPAGGMLFDRTVTNSTDTDSNLFAKQVQINREHAGCFPIEEEILVEEESMDHHTATNKLGKRFGSSSNKSVLSTKNILTDSAKHNSPLSTPGGRFCESIITSSTDKRLNLSKKQALLSPKCFNFSNLGGQACVKENINGLQKRYGSSVRKDDSKTPNVRAGSNFASQISPRISQKPSNILCNVKSFIPLVQQKQAAASIMTGKRDIKVKALEAAEAAKRLEEKREQERKMRKELARRGEKEGEESSIACSDSNKSISSGMARKKPVGCTLQSQAGTSVIGVDLKLRRALEAKNKLEQDKLRKLEEKKQKEEERKKNAAEAAANKRKKEEMDKRDREEKRRRLEEAQKQQKELEEQLRAEKEAKEQRRRALDDYERKRKAMEEEAKKQRRIEKEREAAERRRRIEEDAKSNKFVSKDAKHMQDVHQHNETTLQAPNAYAGKVSSMSTSFAKGTLETEGQSMLDSNASLSSKSNINIESYEISPYKGSDEEDNDDVAPGKIIPLWARKENLIPHIISQQYIDPDEIFTGARTCSLNEVFESNGSNRRRDFKRRSHSGEWLNDCFTWKEEYQYKLQMGYINKGD
ncbi:hypothetical protein SUGI_0263170 [Cryptomeria japonica]|uniref:uncharacterized protein LOC131069509 n=1 Tax=Cryptomeria japonica TaxID=3369 RepID=UPI002408D1B6|nr:uncharacterized protein LOC131069509 [Cryptomeria japonica]GLJ15925.1 hypothetical protein SUGI_0263170 [Cryptomeria japonica]